jgi:hypothetical protein
MLRGEKEIYTNTRSYAGNGLLGYVINGNNYRGPPGAALPLEGEALGLVQPGGRRPDGEAFLHLQGDVEQADLWVGRHGGEDLDQVVPHP